MLPDVLYLVHRVPYPPDKGDRIRTYHLLRHLSTRANIHLATLADEPVPPETTAALTALCHRLAIVPVDRTRWLRGLWSLASGATVSEGVFSSPALRAVVREWTSQTRYHAVFASSSSLASYLRLDCLRDVPAVVDLVDVDSEKWRAYAASSRFPKSWLYRTEGRRLRQLEQDLPGWVRAVTLVSEDEAALYRTFSRPGVIQAVPNGVDLDYYRPIEATEESSCVFVGALDYRPNVEGASWFAEEVWPHINRLRPQSKLYLVGRRPVPAVLRLGSVPGVEVVGQVPDVRPYVAKAAVSVNPLRIARGVQNKVLEALAMAKAVVGSHEALTGIAVEPGVQVLRAASAAEWCDAVLRLFDDAALRRRLGQAGREYVEERHRWESCLEPIGTLLGLVPSERNHRPATERSVLTA